MSLEITGKLVKILPELKGVSAAGKDWKKQDFVIETSEEQYPKNVCITAFGEKSDILRTLTPGETIKVSLNLESREYNEKWYTNVNAWRIDKVGASQGGGSAAGIPDLPPFDPSLAKASAEDDLPF